MYVNVNQMLHVINYFTVPHSVDKGHLIITLILWGHQQSHPHSD